jgi:Transposase DDE domain
VDKRHQIIIDAQAFGEGQEHHTLQPVLETIKDRYKRLGFSDNLYHKDIIATADTGFANEANNRYLHEKGINAYVPDNRFRSRDPKNKTCTCPAGESLWLKNEGIDKRGNYKLFFEGRLSKCRHCALKNKCMTNPTSADTRKGHGRQVSFILDNKSAPQFYRLDETPSRQRQRKAHLQS